MPTWLRSPVVLLAACILLPPLGLVLLWMRPAGILKKLLGTGTVGVIVLAELVFVFGMRFERKGDGLTPILSFEEKEKHYEEIERNRSAQTDHVKNPADEKVSAMAPPVSAKPDAPASTEASPAAMVTVIPAVWTSFRGPDLDGVYRQGEILTKWPEKGLPLVWKQPIGLGYSSFVAGEGRAYTIEQRREKEVVAAYDIQTGKEVWTHSYGAFFQESMGGDGPRATPAYHGGYVFSLGATGRLCVLNAKTGAVRWAKNILDENQASNLPWGMSASPLIVDDKVVVQPGGNHGKSVVAYNKHTGEAIWKSLDDTQAYTSPMLVNLAGRRQILTVTKTRVVGLDPESGRLLWDYPWETEYGVNSAQPIVVDPHRFLISAGYGHGTALVELTGSGDSLQARKVWESKRMKNRFNSSVVYKGYMYGLDEGILSCLRVSDGAQMWKGGRYGYGQLLLASGHLVVLSEEGDLVLIKANPERLVEVAKFSAIEGKTWNVPAIENGLLLVRNGNQMACFRIGA
ncbi:MAG: PQQ-like beta-propeller repeat protein [Bryobacterales bacterium]|nr:PQQ-like beta-propeller repeat protein [Bryobacterales bacterium]